MRRLCNAQIKDSCPVPSNFSSGSIPYFVSALIYRFLAALSLARQQLFFLQLSTNFIQTEANSDTHIFIHQHWQRSTFVPQPSYMILRDLIPSSLVHILQQQFFLQSVVVSLASNPQHNLWIYALQWQDAQSYPPDFWLLFLRFLLLVGATVEVF